MYKISLLQATRGDYKNALKIREKWLDFAKNPDDIEHIFGFGKKDKQSLPLAKKCGKKQFNYVITNNKNKVGGDAVLNWNSSAELSSGNLLFCIADDLHPFQNWDLSLLEKLSVRMYGYYVISINDFDGGMLDKNDKMNNGNKLLCRHPIMTRNYYLVRGYIFYPSYYGIYCDNDLTIECIKKGMLLDFTHLKFKHDSFATEILLKKRKMTESFDIIYSNDAHEYGKKVFIKRQKFFNKIYPND